MSLWHLDANLKLKVLVEKCCAVIIWVSLMSFKFVAFFSWRFYINGAIHGYSRIFGFLAVAANNLASTVFGGFMTAVEKIGLPSRVR